MAYTKRQKAILEEAKEWITRTENKYRVPMIAILAQIEETGYSVYLKMTEKDLNEVIAKFYRKEAEEDKRFKQFEEDLKAGKPVPDKIPFSAITASFSEGLIRGSYDFVRIEDPDVRWAIKHWVYKNIDI